MKRIASAGFTLIELLVVIAIISILAVALLPNIVSGQLAGDIAADRANLSWHYSNLQIAYKNRRLPMPPDGGHKFVLSPWVQGICERTAQNRDRFFTPGLMNTDVRWNELKNEDPKTIWGSYDELTSEDTHYAGRGRKHFRNMFSGHEALLANDNEMGPTFSDGTINVLMGDGTVVSLYKADQLKEHWQDDDPGFYITVGPDSPVEILQKLDY